jgi:LEA14-like dessication related protein
MFLRRGFITSILLMALISGCASLVQEPRVTLNETRMVGLDMDGVDIEFSLSITNPNSFDLSLLNYTYNLLVLDLPLSTGGKQETILFPAGKETGVQLPVRLKFTELLDIIKQTKDPDKIPYHLNSILHLSTPLGEIAIPVEKNSVLIIPGQYRLMFNINRLRDALRGNR